MRPYQLNYYCHNLSILPPEESALIVASNPLSNNACVFNFRNVKHSLDLQGVRNSFVVDEFKIALSASSAMSILPHVSCSITEKGDRNKGIRSCWKSKASMSFMRVEVRILHLRDSYPSRDPLWFDLWFSNHSVCRRRFILTLKIDT